MVHEVTPARACQQQAAAPDPDPAQGADGHPGKQQDYLDQTLKAVTAQSRYFANATGNGPWIEVFAPDFLITDNVFCAVTSPRKCK